MKEEMVMDMAMEIMVTARHNCKADLSEISKTSGKRFTILDKLEAKTDPKKIKTVSGL